MAKKALQQVVPLRKTNVVKMRLDDLLLYTPATQAQERFYELFDAGHQAIMLHGVAGTGKTFIALYKAMEATLDQQTPFQKVIVVRSVVAGRDIGFLPGTETEKVSVFTRPYIDIAAKLFKRHDAFEHLILQDSVEFMTTSFARGITLDDVIVIIDEAQNLNWQEISTIMSRLGQNTKVIICGDFRQTDLYRKDDASGLGRFVEVTRMMPSFRSVEFEKEDIVRGGLCREWIEASLLYEDNQYATKQELRPK